MSCTSCSHFESFVDQTPQASRGLPQASQGLTSCPGSSTYNTCMYTAQGELLCDPQAKMQSPTGYVENYENAPQTAHPQSAPQKAKTPQTPPAYTTWPQKFEAGPQKERKPVGPQLHQTVPQNVPQKRGEAFVDYSLMNIAQAPFN